MWGKEKRPPHLSKGWEDLATSQNTCPDHPVFIMAKILIINGSGQRGIAPMLLRDFKHWCRFFNPAD
ncbi:MAG: hypothetical protein R2788_08205 [Saprospiraceae bacterium]